MSIVEFPKLNRSRQIKEYYEIGDEIGRGAFSIVVEGVQKISNRPVAIKIVDKKHTTAKQMMDELAVMSHLIHEHIVEYVEVFNRSDGYYVVIERIYGGELFDRIIELNNYSEAEAVNAMRQTFTAIKHIHDNDFVHRDLKPENLLLASRDSNVNIKIADFGFASKIKDKGLRSVVGTPPYMSPELVILRHGDKSLPGYSKPVDCWSIGVILYILLSGIHPFQLEDEDEMLDNIEKGEWEWIGEQWDEVSEGAKDLIKGLINPDPNTRLTVDQALAHPWITGGQAASNPLSGARENIKKFQAKKRFKGAIFSVIATNRLKRSIDALRKGLPESEDKDDIETN
jgi:serine/threonine protein kinase